MRPAEQAFIESMLRGKQGAEHVIASLSKCLVEEMDDGRMGGLKFISECSGRRLGQALSATEFVDEDGVTVVATLSLDNHSELYELDVWKTDFSPLKRFPSSA